MKKPIVLSVEDNDADFYLIQMALEECMSQITLTRLADGEQAIAFMERFEDGTSTLPNLILLDANLPRCDGFEVLQAMRSKACLSQIPVIMFTSSANEVEKRLALKLGASEFITKSNNLEDMMSSLSLVCSKLFK